MVCCASGALSLACGGNVSSDPGADNTSGRGGAPQATGGSGQGGSAGMRGDGRSGEAGAAPFWTCLHEGGGHLPGASFPSSDGCNTCQCHANGEVRCTALACDPRDYCIYAGVVYASGESFETECNTCTCVSGSLDCIAGVCPARACADLSAEYAAALVEAKRCDPTSLKVQCPVQVRSSLRCGCSTSYNYAMPELISLAIDWERNDCSTDVLCGACPSELTAGYCDSSGTCVDRLLQ